MARPRKPKVTSIRVTTYYYTSESSGDRKVSERVLEPETDEFEAWVSVYGDGTNRKRGETHIPPSKWQEPKAKREEKSVEVDADTQLNIKKIMAPEFNDIAEKLYRKGIIDDKQWIQDLMFDVCCRASLRHIPGKSTLKVFLKIKVRSWLKDYLKHLHRQKRDACFVVLEERRKKNPGEEAEADEFGIESFADPRALADQEYKIKLRELKSMCSKKECAILDFLLAGGSKRELAKRLKVSWFVLEHQVLDSIKRKLYECFGFPKCYEGSEGDS